jgi:hypothetical protein
MPSVLNCNPLLRPHQSNHHRPSVIRLQLDTSNDFTKLQGKALAAEVGVSDPGEDLQTL